MLYELNSNPVMHVGYTITLRLYDKIMRHRQKCLYRTIYSLILELSCRLQAPCLPCCTLQKHYSAFVFNDSFNTKEMQQTLRKTTITAWYGTCNRSPHALVSTSYRDCTINICNSHIHTYIYTTLY